MGRMQERLEEELELRGYSDKTILNYVMHVRQFVRHHMRPPEEMGEQEIRRYILYLTREKKLSYSSVNGAVCSLKFFYEKVLRRDWASVHVSYQKTRRRLPLVLSEAEVERLILAVRHPKHRMVLTTIYSAGLRISEAVCLRLADIDNQRKTILIRGKGRKDRYVMLSVMLLEMLRKYWKMFRPHTWLFYGQTPEVPMTTRSVQRAFKRARDAAGIAKPATVHTLRHSFATHLMEGGTHLRYIQMLLGHTSPNTTAIYTKVTREHIAEVPSPLDRLEGLESPLDRLRLTDENPSA